jgi:hypothetical protein
MTIFINYRSSEGAFLAATLHTRLAGRFGEHRVFMDGRSIALGDDFSEAILGAVRESALMLVLIGQHWRGERGDGSSRLDDPDDWIRLEIAEALRHQVRVIPVLFNGAAMPRETQLPSDIAALASRQYFVLHHQQRDNGLARLVQRLTKLAPELELRGEVDGGGVGAAYDDGDGSAGGWGVLAGEQRG